MESTAIEAVDLFANEIPTMEQIEALEEIINSSEKTKLDFELKLENNIEKTGAEAALANGIALCLLGRYLEAIEKLEKAKDCKQKYVFLAEAMERRRFHDKAVNYINMALKNAPDDWKIRAKAVNILIAMKKYEDAQKTLNDSKQMENTAERQLLIEKICRDSGDKYKAIEAAKMAAELDKDNKAAVFSLAGWADCCGDDEAMNDYYKAANDGNKIYVNALLNWTVVLEGMKKYEEALKCVDKVLARFPNHKRAIMFKKDIRADVNMVLDEDEVQLRLKRNVMLDTPITDFELSVRSRNCLKKMNIHTIGDLLRTSEAELLSYKNFGETSLREIKAILDVKNLRLGMECENVQTMELSKQSEQDNSLMTKSIDELRLSVRARKCLDKLNLRTLGELVKKTEAELLGCKNFGVTSLNEIKKAIEPLGLSLRSLE